MSGSFIFTFHLLGFGLICAVIVGGWLINLRLMKVQEPALKVFLGGFLRTFGLLLPLAAVILLVTGIGNIYNLYYETPTRWYQEGWLVVKIILFGVMLVNGTVFGPILGRRRFVLLKQSAEMPATEEGAKTLAYLNRQINWFYVVQTVLLLGIVFFSAFGTSKHPGYF